MNPHSLRLETLASLALVITVCAGCSPPEEHIAEAALRQEIESQSKGNIKLVSFTKTDGQSASPFGVESREVDYEAEIEFEHAGVWLSGGWPGRLSYNFSATYQMPQTTTAAMLAAVDGPIRVHHSDQVKIKGKMSGTKKDSGWQYQTFESSQDAGTTQQWWDSNGKLIRH